MTKNMTRKGLALGAAFALVGSALVATPAHAVDPVQLSINAGTSLNVFAQETVVLKSLFTNAGQAASETLRYRIVDASEKLNITSTKASTDAAGTAGAVPGVALDTDKVEVINSANATAGTANYLTLVPATQAAGSEASFDVVVTAWLDFDGDEVIDTGEASATTTVKFLKFSDVSATWTAIDNAFGTKAVKYEATLSPAMNTSYITKVTATVSAAGGAVAVAEKSGAAGTLVVSRTTTNDLAAGDLTTALLYDAKEVSKTVSAIVDTKVDTVTAVLTDTTDTTTGGKVRTGTTSGTVVFSLKNAAGEALGAGIRTDVVINNAGTPAVVAATDTLTVAGKAVLNAASADVTVTYVTDANGQVVVPFSSGKGTAANKFAIMATASGKPSAVLTVVWEDAAYTAMTVTQDVAQSGDYQVTTTVGATVPVSFKVEDQFGLAVADSYFVSVARTAGTRATTAGSFAGSANFSGANASINIVDNGAGTGDDTYTATLVKRNTNGTTTATAVTATVDITFAASAAVSAITVTENATALTITDGKATLAATAALTLADLGAAADVAAQKLTVGTSVKGALVTISSTSAVMFKVHGKSVYQAGSITVNANSAGAVEVTYLTNTSGDHTITVTAGGKTVTLAAKAAAAAGNTGTTLVITAPDNVLPGSTLAASVKLTDKYGNPVLSAAPATFSFTAVSPGIQVGTNPTATDASGVAKLAYFLGNNDSGTITLTATYDADGATTTIKPVTVTKTIVIGASATKVAAFTKRAGDKIQIVSQGSAKVRFMLNGKRVATRSSLGTLNRTFDLVDGKNVIEIYVDGKRVLRRAATK